jgi:hypothetical protein
MFLRFLRKTNTIVSFAIIVAFLAFLAWIVVLMIWYGMPTYGG